MFWPHLTFYSAVLSSVSCCLLVMNLLTLWVYPFTHKEPSKQETTAETKWFQRGSRPGSGQSRCLYVVPAHQGNNRSRNNRGNKVGRFQRGSRPGSGQSRCLDVNVVFRRVIDHDRLSSTKGTTHHALQNTCETGNNRSRETTDHDR